MAAAYRARWARTSAMSTSRNAAPARWLWRRKSLRSSEATVRSWEQSMRDGFPEVRRSSHPQTDDYVPSVQEVDRTLRWLAHKAVHVNEPTSRKMMRDAVARTLLAGEPLPEVAAEWLLFVLGKLKDMPTLAPTKQ